MASEARDLIEILRDCLREPGSAHCDVFVRRTRPVIAQTVNRTLARYSFSSQCLPEDLLQDIFLKLCEGNKKVLRAFRGADSVSLCAYLRAIAASVTIDFINSAQTKTHGGDAQTDSLDDPDSGIVVPDKTPLARMELQFLLDRVKRCLIGWKERDKTVFWLHHRSGYAPREIAAFPGLGLKRDGVEMLLYRLTKEVTKCVKSAPGSATFSEGDRA